MCTFELLLTTQSSNRAHLKTDPTRRICSWHVLKVLLMMDALHPAAVHVHCMGVIQLLTDGVEATCKCMFDHVHVHKCS